MIRFICKVNRLIVLNIYNFYIIFRIKINRKGGPSYEKSSN